MPHPADRNWAVRSDLAYDINHGSHARRLTHEQSTNQDDEPSILKSSGPSGQPGPSGLLFQQTGNRNLKGYNQLYSKVKAESAHTLVLNNGVVLRKSGVATKLNEGRLKQGQNQLCHRQLRGKLKSGRQRGLLHRSNGRKAAADLRTVVLNRKIVTTY